MFGIKAERIAPGVFMVGGPELSDPRDCLCYLAVGESARVLIDCGCGPSAGRILKLARDAGGGPPTHLLITHAHIDHAGGAAAVRQSIGCAVLAHPDEAAVLAAGDSKRSAADWYNMDLPPLEVDETITGGDVINLGPGQDLHILHTPGHTPGCLCAWMMAGSEKVLFGQDLHGPFFREFGSDLGQYAESMDMLMKLAPDVLCEGHYGVFRPASSAAAFMRQQMLANLGRG